jgi:hypothetical protein
MIKVTIPTRSDAALVRVLTECVFISVVTESKTCCIYEMVLQTIKTVTRNLSDDDLVVTGWP